MIYVRNVKDMGGYDTNGNRYIIVELVCDEETDLPNQNYFIAAKCIIAQCSTAVIINTGAKYQMKSNGTWVLIQAGQATYTKSEIDSMIANVYTKSETDNLISSVDFCAVGETIPQNADLNDTTYRKRGIYGCGQSTAATLSNCPVTVGFRLEVVQIAFSTLYQQRLFPQSRLGDSLYIRTGGFVNSVYTWGNWYKYTGIQV